MILTTKGIDDMALKYFVEAGALAVRRVPKDDMKWVHGGGRMRAVPVQLA